MLKTKSSVQFHLNCGRVGNTQLIPKEVMKWMHRNNNPIQITGWKSQPDQQVFFYIGYGLGFRLSSFDGETNRGVSNSAGSLIEAASETLRSKNLNKKPTVSICEYYDGPLQVGEILGHYGNGLVGELDITEKVNLSGDLQPYLNYGDWGYGWLNQISNNEFLFECESDYVQVLYNAGFNESFAQPTLTYDTNLQTIIFDDEEIHKKEFQKNQELVDLSERPWNPDSCGPELVKQNSS